MVTLIVGRKNGTENLVRLKTLCDGADEPTDVEIDINKLKAGNPKWVYWDCGVITRNICHFPIDSWKSPYVVLMVSKINPITAAEMWKRMSSISRHQQGHKKYNFLPNYPPVLLRQQHKNWSEVITHHFIIIASTRLELQYYLCFPQSNHYFLIFISVQI